MRLDRFGIYAAEKWIAISPNLLAFDSVSPEKLAQQLAACPMHWVDDESELRRPQPIPVNQSRNCFKVGHSNVERMNYVRTRRERRHAISQHLLKLVFNLGNDGGRSGASIAGLVLHPIPLVRIVAGRDLNSTGGISESHEQGNRGRGARFARQPYRCAGGCDGLCRRTCEAL